MNPIPPLSTIPIEGLGTPQPAVPPEALALLAVGVLAAYATLIWMIRHGDQVRERLRCPLRLAMATVTFRVAPDGARMDVVRCSLPRGGGSCKKACLRGAAATLGGRPPSAPSRGPRGGPTRYRSGRGWRGRRAWRRWPPTQTHAPTLRLVALALAVALAHVMAGAAGAGEGPSLLLGATPPKLEVDGPLASKIRLEVSNRVRGEFWSYFRTADTGPAPNSDYHFLGNRFQLGVRVNRDPVEMFAQLQHSLVWSAPKNAPGAGGVYYLNTKRELQQEPIFRQGWVRLKNAFTVTGLSTVAGRQLYRDGVETPAKDPTLQWVQKFRIGERLIGPFDYTHIGRSFDGGQIAYDHELFNVTGFGFVPTAGGYEISANREIGSIYMAGLSVTAKESEQLPGTLARLFWDYYDDHRNITFLDNRPESVRAADKGSMNVHTVGGQLAHVHAIGPGKADVLAWAAGQFGEWQSLTHRAWDYAFEAGYQLPDLWAAPWLRAGIGSGSGDQDPNDGTHETFFQMLPTARIYAQFPFYNLMNNQDVFGQLLLRPHRMLQVRSDLHWLRVNASQDFLYAGGGATSQHFFGYSGTATGGRNEIGYLADVALNFTPNPWLTLYAYYGHVFGQGVINQAFLGRNADYGYIEATVAF